MTRIELHALCKGNARMYKRSLHTLARGVGRGFMPGLERAIDNAGDVLFRPPRNFKWLSY